MLENPRRPAAMTTAARASALAAGDGTMPFDPKTYGTTPLTVRFPEANFRDVSEAARAFIRDLLVLDPAQRLSASRARCARVVEPTLRDGAGAGGGGSGGRRGGGGGGAELRAGAAAVAASTTPLPTPSRLRQFRNSGNLRRSGRRRRGQVGGEAAAVAAAPRPDGGKASGKRGLGGGEVGRRRRRRRRVAAVADDEREEVCLELPAEVTKRLRSGSGEGGAARSEAGPTSSAGLRYKTSLAATGPTLHIHTRRGAARAPSLAHSLAPPP